MYRKLKMTQVWTNLLQEFKHKLRRIPIRRLTLDISSDKLSTSRRDSFPGETGTVCPLVHDLSLPAAASVDSCLTEKKQEKS